MSSRSSFDASASRQPPPPFSRAFNEKSVDRSACDQRNARSHSAFGDTICGSRRPQTELTIVVLGACKVGKSAIVNQFLHGVFRPEYEATVDDLYWIEYDATAPTSVYPTALTHKDHKHRPETTSNTVGIFLLKIIDASGSHEFIGMRRMYEQQGDAFILVVSVDDKDSLEEAKVIRREIRERNQKNVPVIIVLNKIDLKSTTVKENFCRENEITSEEMQEFASSTGSLFIEATATKYESVAEIFQRLLQQHSSVPQTAELKYRRKSVPTVNMSVSDFAPLKGVALKRVALPGMQRPRPGAFGDEEGILEEENEGMKKRSCVIS